MTRNEQYGRHAKHAQPHTQNNSFIQGPLPVDNLEKNNLNANTWSSEHNVNNFVTTQTIPEFYTTSINPYSRNNYTRKRTRKTKKIVIGIICGLLTAFIVSLGISGIIMYSSLDDLKSQASTLQENIIKGDVSKAKEAADELLVIARRINGQTHMPQWTIACHFPFIGNDFRCIQSFTSVADSLISSIVVPATSQMVVRGTGALMVEDNRINAQAIQVILEILDSSQVVIHESTKSVQELDWGRIGRLNSLRAQLYRFLVGLDTLAIASPDLAPNIVYLLGADGAPRQYLLVALSSAEIRSIGGLPGSYGVLTVDNGKFSVDNFLALKDTPRYVPISAENEDAETIAPGLTDEEQILFGRRVVNVPAETATNPQFSRFAESFSWLRTYRGHGETDGVFAIDAFLLENILAITGEVHTSGGIVVSSNNASRLLLHDAYSTMTGEEQDAFFSEVASSCFNALFDNMTADKIVAVAKQIWHMSNSRHIQAWIPNEQVEQAINTLGYSGSLSSTTNSPVLGIYINDDTWSKISWYLSADTTVEAAVENADGSWSFQVTTVLRNHLTEDEIAAQPDYVTGSNWRKRSKGDMLDWIFFYAPMGGTISNMTASAYFTPLEETRSGFNGIEEISGMNQAEHLGHNVWYAAIQIAAGETASFSYTVTTSPDTELGYLLVDQTPTAQQTAGW